MFKKREILGLNLKIYKLAFLFVLLFPAIKGHAQGLQFNSNDSLLSRRTSYNVFNNNLPTFYDHFLVSFDMSLWDNEHLGYVFNITDTKSNSYSLTYIYNGSPTLNFNIDSKSTKIQIPLNPVLLKKRQWMHVKVYVDLKANEVGILINGQWYRASDFGFDNTMTARIIFGKNEHYFDVPNMAIKNLTISDKNQNFRFPLKEWNGESVYDNKGTAVGTVDNPVWLINESYFWTPKLHRSFDEVAGINFNERDQKLFMFKSDSLILYDVQKDVVSAKTYQNKLPVTMLLGKSIINTKENKCYLYEVMRSPKPSPRIAALDLATLKWDVVGQGNIKEQRHHHNIFYDKDQNDIYLFGGYGSFSYYNDFFKYNRATDTWDKISFTGDKINPRFFSGYSQADANNDVYIFGGYGNQSGNQVVGGKHYYDLYRVNLTNHTIKKCWEIKPNGDDFVAANNLIVSKDKNYFYALCYAHEKPKTNLRLYKFAIKDGSYEVVSGNIPAKGERIETDINLFFNAKQNQFFCTIQEFTSPLNSTVRILSLASPPVRQQDYEASQRVVTPSHKLYKYILLAVLVVLAALGAVLYVKRKKPNETNAAEAAENDLAVIPVPVKDEEKKANAVYLLGEFTVYDKNSKDITYLFSPKIKQLFILILLSSKDEAGVVSKRISTTLWPDKDVVKTKNIKGVTINHLRNILADIEGIELTFLNDTYSFKLGDNLFCDYFIVNDDIKKVNAHDSADDQTILNHFDLIARGGLLQHIAEGWLDDIKLEYEESLMPFILPEVKRIYETGDFRKALEISRVVLHIDPFSDIAIKYKLKALRRIKGIDFARKTYDEFIHEYEKSLGVEYAIPFDKICTNKT
ncbi:Kelch motif-containing protein [Mucilaginibacter pineti]|uniref:Kelch motif-containing protein n=2 Tax=Mucilaginibacter pineti TaxID=1391627 RepID=A0A1G7D8X6_9SPHI|nr:Kelch motif-containing protein [Mucilaginibacter pineti]